MQGTLMVPWISWSSLSRGCEVEWKCSVRCCGKEIFIENCFCLDWILEESLLLLSGWCRLPSCAPGDGEEGEIWREHPASNAQSQPLSNPSTSILSDCGARARSAHTSARRRSGEVSAGQKWRSIIIMAENWRQWSWRGWRPIYTTGAYCYT